MLAAPTDRSSAWLSPAAIVFLFGVWLLCHPYEGLIHDGILYAGQALRHLHPEVFDGDLFFAGAASQDDFTVFGRLYRALAATLGLSAAGVLLYALGQAAWFGVALAWIRQAAPGLGLPLVACLLALRYPYSADGRLELAESFVTARLLAEPLALSSLLFGFRGVWLPAAGMLAAAAVVHPLLAAPAAGVLGSLVLARRIGWMRLLTMSAAAVALVAVVGLAAPVTRMDPEWFELVRIRNHFVVPAGWSVDGLARWATALLMLLTAAAVARSGFADLWRAVALVAVLGVALAFVGDQTRWVTLIQVQAWRAIWPATWFAPLAVAAAAIGQERIGARFRMLGLLPAFALAQLGWIPGAGVIALVYAALVRLSVDERRGRWFGQHDPLAATVVAGGLAVLAVGAGIVAIAAVVSGSDAVAPLDRLVRTFAMRMLGWAALAGFAWWAIAGSPAGAGVWRIRWTGTAVLVAALTLLDARPPIASEAERLDPALDEWRSLIPARAQVFWPERHRYVWTRLQRRSYVSFRQSAGILFDRVTAFEAYRRRAVIEPISARDGVFALASTGGPTRVPLPAQRDLHRTCAADGKLDFLVLTGEVPGNLGPTYVEPFSATRYRLYACRDFR